jgi:hypothetical protein
MFPLIVSSPKNQSYKPAHLTKLSILVYNNRPMTMTITDSQYMKLTLLTWDCQAVTSLRQREVETTLILISMGWGGLTSTCSITNDSPAPHATAAFMFYQCIQIHLKVKYIYNFSSKKENTYEPTNKLFAISTKQQLSLSL